MEKLQKGTWQQRMLENNLKALHYALSLMDTTKSRRKSPDDAEINAYLKSLDEMIIKSKAAQKKFLPGIAQHTLLKNRLNSLKAAKISIEQAR